MCVQVQLPVQGNQTRARELSGSPPNTRHWTHIALSMSTRAMSIFFPASAGMNPRQVPISKMLRHTSIETTQRYYARIRSEVAFEEFERIWDTPTISVQETAN